MAHFYGSIKGTRSKEVSRLGSKNSGLHTVAMSRYHSEPLKLIRLGLLTVALIMEGVGIVTTVRAIEHHLHRQLIPRVTVRIQYL